MDRTELKILDAAIKVFSSEGYKGATTRRIAQEADVSEVTLFRKFQSKENILRTVIIKVREEALQTLDLIASMEKEADLRTGLLSLGRYIMKALSDNIDMVFLTLEEGRRKPEIAEITATIPQMAVARLSEYFDLQIKKGKMRSIDTRAAALTFLGYPYCILIFKRIHADEVLGISEKEFEAFIEIFAKGIENSDNIN